MAILPPLVASTDSIISHIANIESIGWRARRSTLAALAALVLEQTQSRTHRTLNCCPSRSRKGDPRCKRGSSVVQASWLREEDIYWLRQRCFSFRSIPSSISLDFPRFPLDSPSIPPRSPLDPPPSISPPRAVVAPTRLLPASSRRLETGQCSAENTFSVRSGGGALRSRVPTGWLAG